MQRADRAATVPPSRAGAPDGTTCLLFETALGVCGVAWRGEVVTRVVLPGDEHDVRRRLLAARHGVHADAAAVVVDVLDGAVLPLHVAAGDGGSVDAAGPLDTSSTGGTDGRVPAWVARLVAEVRAALHGDGVDLAWVPVDLDGLTGTARDVYEHVRTIARGDTASYGEVASAIGRPGGAQAVGAAMGANPVPLLVPCHRVVGADGRMVGFSGPGGVATKRRLLELEGAAVVAQRSLFD